MVQRIKKKKLKIKMKMRQRRCRKIHSSDLDFQLIELIQFELVFNKDTIAKPHFNGI